MSPLSDLQNDFRSFLLRGGDRMTQRVRGTAKASAPTRLAIYYDAYRLRLLEALDSNYPVLHAWIGDDEFEKLGLAYLEAHPSTHFSIRYFGHRLVEYLAASAEYGDKPYLREMASLEWAMSEAFDAPDSPLVNLDDMAAISPDAWPDMRLQFHASLHRLDLRWNVPPIWKAINQIIAVEKSGTACRGETSATPSPQRGGGEGSELPEIPTPTADTCPQPWLIWRQDLKTFYRSLSVDEAWALDAARKGESFASICEGLCEWIDAQNAALHAAGLLKQWILDGLISEIKLS